MFHCIRAGDRTAGVGPSHQQALATSLLLSLSHAENGTEIKEKKRQCSAPQSPTSMLFHSRRFLLIFRLLLPLAHCTTVKTVV